MKNALSVAMTLKYAIRKAVADHAKGKNFSRRSPLTMETLIRLLIGMEGGSLDKILHTAGIKVAASAVNQRLAQIDPSVFRAVFDTFNTDCPDSTFFRGYRLLAVDGTAVNLPRNPVSPFGRETGS